MPSWKTPTAEQVDRVVGKLVHHEQIRYFFDGLDNPLWIRPLRQKGFFKNLPPPDVGEEARTTQFPISPATRYLARMAKHDPEEVAEAILEGGLQTNFRVVDDYVQAAREMPPKIAAKLVGRIIELLPQHTMFGLPEDVGRLVNHLAIGGEFTAAVTLVQSLLRLKRDERTHTDDEGTLLFVSSNAVSNMHAWDYQQTVELMVPTLTDAAGIRALDTFRRLLNDAVPMELRQGAAPPDDLSFSWRPAIEDHRQNRSEHFIDSLVWAVRETAERLIAADPESTPNVIARVERHEWHIFSRIALYLLSCHGEGCPDVIRDHLLDPRLSATEEVRHEYNALARRFFGSMGEADRERILDLVDAGPDTSWYIERTTERLGVHPSNDDVEKFKRHWQWTKLEPLAQGLSEPWAIRHNALLEEFGPREHDFLSYMTTSWDRKEEELPVELGNLNVPDLVSFLRTYEPTDIFGRISLESLVRQVTDLVSSSPSKYTEEARRFTEAHPRYVRAFFNGLREALTGGREFGWAHALELASWVVDQSDDAVTEENSLDREPGWHWVRDAIADLLSSSFEDRPGQMPVEMRDAAWEVLAKLTEDPNPTPEHEAQYGGTNMDPMTLSLNTTRGKAMHAVFRYALWVLRVVIGDQPQVGLSSMPEVEAVLARHLDPSVDPSPSIRAVYGQWLPQLTYLDGEWVARYESRIFPDDEGLADLRDAAWDTFVVLSRPFDSVLRVLEGQYRKAIERLDRPSAHRTHLGDPQERLGEHLTTWYWHGRLTIDDSLFSSFFARASDDVRGGVMGFLGRSLHGLDEPLGEEVVARLLAFAEWRLGAAETQGAAHCQKELAEFGWWFASKALDAAWSIKTLVRAVVIAGKAEADHRVMERLAELVDHFPAEVLICVDVMLKNDRDGWHPQVWRKELRVILRRAVDNGDDAAREQATQIINWLGMRGYTDYGELLT